MEDMTLARMLNPLDWYILHVLKDSGPLSVRMLVRKVEEKIIDETGLYKCILGANRELFYLSLLGVVEEVSSGTSKPDHKISEKGITILALDPIPSRTMREHISDHQMRDAFLREERSKRK